MDDRNEAEASWLHTRRQRQETLERILARATEALRQDKAGDHMVAVLFVAVELVKDPSGDTRPKAHAAGVAYGRDGVRVLVHAADDALAHIAETVQAGEQARKESVVGGKRRLQ